MPNIPQRVSTNIQISYLLAMLMVLLLHSWNLETTLPGSTHHVNDLFNIYVQNTISGLCQTAVPFFFCISGYLFFFGFVPGHGSFQEKIKKRFRSLILPYLIWCAVTMLTVQLLQWAPGGKSFFTQLIMMYLLFSHLSIRVL